LFSLIITIISIALVAILAIATIYYGGEAMRKGSAQARAVTYMNQAQQILGSAQLFKATQGRWPTSLDELIATSHLKTAPMPPVAQVPQIPLIPSAYAADDRAQWTTVQLNAPFYWVRRNVTEDVCRGVNLLSRGDDGVYNAAIPGLTAQCFGVDEMYTVILGYPGAVNPTMEEAVKGVDPALDVDDSGGGWAVEPSKYGPSAGGAPLSTDTIAFGSIPVGGSTSNGATFTNKTQSPVTINGLTGLPASVTRKTGSGMCGVGGYVLAAGASCRIELVYAPTSTGSLPNPTTVTLSTTYPQTPNFPINLSGTGQAPSQPAASLSTPKVDFTPIAPNATATKTIFVTNSGTAPLTVSSVVVGDKTNYSVTNDCATALAPKDSCTITLTFAPKSAGTWPTKVTVNTNGSSPVLEVPVTGSSEHVYQFSWGLQPTLAFADQAENSGSQTLTATLKNEGTQTQATPVFTLDDTANYSYTGCTTSIAPGASCTLSVTFAPKSLGEKPATISVKASASGAPYNLTLTGKGVQPTAPTPDQWDAGKFPQSGSYTSIAYGGGTYWVTGREGAGMLKSTDGVNYSWSTGWSNSKDWEVKAVGDKFLFASDDFSTVYIAANSGSGTGKSEVYAAPCCIALTADTTTATWYGLPRPMDEWYHSTTDGVNWTKRFFPSRGANVGNAAYVWTKMAAGNGVKVVTNGYYYATSADGTGGNFGTPKLFPFMTNNSSQSVDAITYGGGRFVATGSNGYVYSSGDGGVTWTRTTLPSTNRYYTLAYGDGTFLAVGYGSTSAAYSKDGGVSWTATTMPAPLSWYSAAYGQGRFTVIAFGSDTFARSRIP